MSFTTYDRSLLNMIVDLFVVDSPNVVNFPRHTNMPITKRKKVIQNYSSILKAHKLKQAEIDNNC